MLNLPFYYAQFQTALASWLVPAFYWKGYMPVEAMLNFLGRVLGFFAMMFTFNVFMYVWNKIPTPGYRVADRSSE